MATNLVITTAVDHTRLTVVFMKHFSGKVSDAIPLDVFHQGILKLAYFRKTRLLFHYAPHLSNPSLIPVAELTKG